MRKRKIRGHKRRWTHIEQWVEYNKELDLNYLSEYQRDYVKIRIQPWSNLCLTNSYIPEPKRITKKKMLEGLITIYNSWKLKLDSLNEPYYLKIWLFEHRFSSSQVVCAKGDYLKFYDHTFYKPEENKDINPVLFGTLKDQIAEFDWDYHWDEDHFDSNELGEPEDYVSFEAYEDTRKWMIKMLKKPHRTTALENDLKLYSLKRGTVWVGGKK